MDNCRLYKSKTKAIKALDIVKWRNKYDLLLKRYPFLKLIVQNVHTTKKHHSTEYTWTYAAIQKYLKAPLPDLKNKPNEDGE